MFSIPQLSHNEYCFYINLTFYPGVNVHDIYYWEVLICQTLRLVHGHESQSCHIWLAKASGDVSLHPYHVRMCAMPWKGDSIDLQSLFMQAAGLRLLWRRSDGRRAGNGNGHKICPPFHSCFRFITGVLSSEASRWFQFLLTGVCK